jgi:hypothetical protein
MEGVCGTTAVIETCAGCGEFWSEQALLLSRRRLLEEYRHRLKTTITKEEAEKILRRAERDASNLPGQNYLFDV